MNISVRHNIMRSLYIFVPLILEGVNMLQPTTLRENEHHIGFDIEKEPKNVEKRSLVIDKRQSLDAAGNLVESVVLAIDTDSHKTDPKSAAKNADKMVETVVKSLDDVFKKSVKNPAFRSKAQEYDIKPELLQIRGNKPTLMLNLKLKDVLRSNFAQRLMEAIYEEAGSIIPQVDK